MPRSPRPSPCRKRPAAAPPPPRLPAPPRPDRGPWPRTPRRRHGRAWLCRLRARAAWAGRGAWTRRQRARGRPRRASSDESRGVAGRIAVERLLAAMAAEVHRRPAPLRPVARRRDLHRHATDGIAGLHGQAKTGRLRQSGLLDAAPPMLDDFGEDAHRDLLRRGGTDVEAGGRLEALEPRAWHAQALQALHDDTSTATARHQADVA